ncbi:hypothetical protein [Wolbachia endosymbiont of Tribolium confusum]|uniref:hypothetical protein n=1 Tax=Wolbachia endosymbiont of Tribolium confusum TaxID=214474 RepID=UPI001CF3FC18|nr:hypothetical protein [Wolbachia endosymbiont of Tribolium confusum]MCA7010854.1 hypothetical protein [Wolbachia endosymbiont of Tribolium confusum]
MTHVKPPFFYINYIFISWFDTVYLTLPALTVGVGCGIAGVGLPILVIASIAASAALVIGLAAAGITYSVLKPSDKLDKPGLKAANQQVPERA